MNQVAVLAIADPSASLQAQPRAAAFRAAGAGLALLTCLCTAAAHESPVPSQEGRAPLAMQGDETGVRLSYEIIDERGRNPPSATPRVRLDGRAPGDWTGASLRLWLSSGRASVGVGIGITASDDRLPSAGGDGDGSNAVARQKLNLTLGMRYRMSKEHAIFADASGAHRAGTDSGNAQDTAKVGVEWKPAKAKFGFERGALGLRLDSGYRLTLRARRGGAGLYLRGQF